MCERYGSRMLKDKKERRGRCFATFSRRSSTSKAFDLIRRKLIIVLSGKNYRRNEIPGTPRGIRVPSETIPTRLSTKNHDPPATVGQFTNLKNFITTLISARYSRFPLPAATWPQSSFNVVNVANFQISS